MEQKRTFIAILLCLFIFYAWLGINSKKTGTATKTMQVIENKELVTTAPSPSLPSDQPKRIEPEETKATITSIATKSLLAEFSNIGGTLKKVTIEKYTASLPVNTILDLIGYEKKDFNLTRQGPNDIEYSFENSQVLIRKQYTISENRHDIEAKIIVKNKTLMSKQTDLLFQAFVVDASSLDKKSGRYASMEKSFNEYVVYSDEGMLRKNKAYEFSAKENKGSSSNVKWIGFRDKYFCTIIKPQFNNNGYKINSISKDAAQFDLRLSSQAIPAGTETSYSFLIYYGPEEWTALKSYKMDFGKIKKFYKFGLFDVIAVFLSEFLNFLHKFIPSWGICIILIGALVYFSMYPLTIRSMASMKKMQSLQPQIAALQKKYKVDTQSMTQEAIAKNKQKLGVETMELYKKHNINPLGGCLPMLLQMPVFIGLYQVLFRSVAFKGAKFLWIKDLSEPDRLFLLPTTLPVIGNEINLLPLLMIVLMFFQQKLSSKNMVSASPDQATQQKMMTIVFPLLFGFIFYKMPSGLTLYFTMFYFYSTFTQWKFAKAV